MEREQILGDEARARVPEQFIPQDIHIVNPPTFVIAIEKLAKKLKMKQDEVEVNADGVTIQSSSDLSFLEISISQLSRWLRYIERSQKSKLSNGLRWYGRTNQHDLACGFDDMPRHSILSEKESNVDLIAWMAYSFKTLSAI